MNRSSRRHPFTYAFTRLACSLDQTLGILGWQKGLLRLALSSTRAEEKIPHHIREVSADRIAALVHILHWILE